jgi:thermitase
MSPSRRVAAVAIAVIAALSASSAQARPGAAPGPVVAVIDTGVDVTHPALRGHLWTNPREVPGNGIDDDLDGYVDDVHGADMVDGDGRPDDVSGHGTHVAGIAVRRPGRQGRPTGARVMSVRVLGPDGHGDVEQLAHGIDYAVNHGARVINLSVAHYDPDPYVWAALANAARAGVVIVCAAGNDATDLDLAPEYPAAYRFPGTIVVASIAAGLLSPFSGYGAGSVDIAAPGVRVLSTLPGGGWGRMTGTSQATAAVSRAAGILLRRAPARSPQEIRAAILNGARRAPNTRGETRTGGVLDVDRALRRLLD